MARFGAVLQHLPELRRYAYVATGTREAGDRLVEICLSALVAAPEVLEDDPPRVALFKLFHEVNAVPTLAPKIGSGEQIDRDARLFLQIGAVDRDARACLLLGHVIGLPVPDLARVVGRSEAEVVEAIAAARRLLWRLVNARVLIIEDDYLIAQEISRIVENLGQQVSGLAATYEEAMACAAKRAPTLVLADVQLRDGRIAGWHAAQSLAQAHHVPLIVITAYPERLGTDSDIRPHQVFTKPFNYAALRSAITSSLLAPSARSATPALA